MSHIISEYEIHEIDAILSWNLEEPEMLDSFLLAAFKSVDNSAIDCMFCEQPLAIGRPIAQHYPSCASSSTWISSLKLAAISRLTHSSSQTSRLDVLCKAFPDHACRMKYLLELDVECIYCGVEVVGGMRIHEHMQRCAQEVAWTSIHINAAHESERSSDNKEDTSIMVVKDFFTLCRRMISTTPAFWYNSYSLLVDPLGVSYICPYCTVCLTFPSAIDIHYRECAGRTDWSAEVVLLKRLSKLTRMLFKKYPTIVHAKLREELDLLSNLGGTAQVVQDRTPVLDRPTSCKARTKCVHLSKKRPEVEVISATSRHRICSIAAGIVSVVMLGHLYTIKRKALF